MKQPQQTKTYNDTFEVITIEVSDFCDTIVSIGELIGEEAN